MYDDNKISIFCHTLNLYNLPPFCRNLPLCEDRQFINFWWQKPSRNRMHKQNQIPSVFSDQSLQNVNANQMPSSSNANEPLPDNLEHDNFHGHEKHQFRGLKLTDSQGNLLEGVPLIQMQMNRGAMTPEDPLFMPTSEIKRLEEQRNNYFQGNMIFSDANEPSRNYSTQPIRRTVNDSVRKIDDSRNFLSRSHHYSPLQSESVHSYNFMQMDQNEDDGSLIRFLNEQIEKNCPNEQGDVNEERSEGCVKLQNSLIKKEQNIDGHTDYFEVDLKRSTRIPEKAYYTVQQSINYRNSRIYEESDDQNIVHAHKYNSGDYLRKGQRDSNHNNRHKFNHFQQFDNDKLIKTEHYKQISKQDRYKHRRSHKQAGQKTKGLKFLSRLCIEQAKRLNEGNNNQVSKMVVQRVGYLGNLHGQQEKEVQNIKRRIYDSINVLTNAGILIKDHKRIKIANCRKLKTRTTTCEQKILSMITNYQLTPQRIKQIVTRHNENNRNSSDPIKSNEIPLFTSQQLKDIMIIINRAQRNKLNKLREQRMQNQAKIDKIYQLNKRNKKIQMQQELRNRSNDRIKGNQGSRIQFPFIMIKQAWKSSTQHNKLTENQLKQPKFEYYNRSYGEMFEQSNQPIMQNSIRVKNLIDNRISHRKFRQRLRIKFMQFYQQNQQFNNKQNKVKNEHHENSYGLDLSEYFPQEEAQFLLNQNEQQNCHTPNLQNSFNTLLNNSELIRMNQKQAQQRNLSSLCLENNNAIIHSTKAEGIQIKDHAINLKLANDKQYQLLGDTDAILRIMLTKQSSIHNNSNPISQHDKKCSISQTPIKKCQKSEPIPKIEQKQLQIESPMNQQQKINASCKKIADQIFEQEDSM